MGSDWCATEVPLRAWRPSRPPRCHQCASATGGWSWRAGSDFSSAISAALAAFPLELSRIQDHQNGRHPGMAWTRDLALALLSALPRAATQLDRDWRNAARPIGGTNADVS